VGKPVARYAHFVGVVTTWWCPYPAFNQGVVAGEGAIVRLSFHSLSSSRTDALPLVQCKHLLTVLHFSIFSNSLVLVHLTRLSWLSSRFALEAVSIRLRRETSRARLAGGVCDDVRGGGNVGEQEGRGTGKGSKGGRRGGIGRKRRIVEWRSNWAAQRLPRCRGTRLSPEIQNGKEEGRRSGGYACVLLLSSQITETENMLVLRFRFLTPVFVYHAAR
jgi:hypothetical protein